MSELGQTRDPHALVPGDSGAVAGTVEQLRRYGQVLVEAGDGLRRIDDGGWVGKAADAFHDFFDGYPVEWIRTGDAFTAAAEALDVHREVLEWAQKKAAEAIRVWEEAQAATAKAAAEYERKATGRATSGGSPLEPFVDPGAEGREHAESMLRLAREQLYSAGEDARVKVVDAKADLVEARSWLGQLWHGVTDFGEGVIDEFAEFGDVAWKLDPARLWAEPGEVLDDFQNLPAAVEQAAANASEDDLIDLRNPARVAEKSALRTAGWVTLPYQLVYEFQKMRKVKPRHHVVISRERYPKTAEHAEEAQNGKTWRGDRLVPGKRHQHPSEVTIDRENAESRRRQAVKVVPAIPRAQGIDRDEYPPAVFEEGGAGSSVKYIPASDNQGAGSSMRHQMTELSNGTEVTINVR